MAWSAFLAYAIDPPARVSMACKDHLVSVLFAGSCRFRERANGRSIEQWTGPGAVQVMPAGFEGTWEGRDRKGHFRALALFVPDSVVTRVIASDWEVDPSKVELAHRFNTRDSVIESLCSRLDLELRSGSPSGAVYAESACEFLVHHLIHAHSSLARPPRCLTGGLPARRLKLVMDYVEEHLAQSVSLRGLAELAGVSPRHFERAFRQAVGVAPHAYLLERRIATARNLLAGNPRLPIHQIAARTGFSSSSHLATAFRRQTGQSPSAFRRLAAK
jgi:AraC family transcriptional regulator